MSDKKPYEKIAIGDHSVIAFNDKPMTLDQVAAELNKLFEIGCIADDAPEINMSNYTDDQVSALNDAMGNVHKIASPKSRPMEIEHNQQDMTDIVFKNEHNEEGLFDSNIYRCMRDYAEIKVAEALAKKVTIASVEKGFKSWAEKPHNTKWKSKIAGTPIQNDLVVCIANYLNKR